MIAKLRSWLLARTPRERRLLLLMVAIALPLLIWLATALMMHAYDNAVRDHLEAVDRNGRVRTLADAARTAPGANGETIAADLELVVMETATQAGISLQGAESKAPNSLDVQVSGASATAAVLWLRGLAARGIQVEELRMTPSPDRTVAMSVRLVRRA